MKTITNETDTIFLAGSTGMVGSSIKRALTNLGYGFKQNKFKLLTPSRKELNLLNTIAVKNWFEKNRPSIVILAAAKVGGILANSTYPADFIIQNLKIQTNVIESAWSTGVKRFLFLGRVVFIPKMRPNHLKRKIF